VEEKSPYCGSVRLKGIINASEETHGRQAELRNRPTSQLLWGLSRQIKTYLVRGRRRSEGPTTGKEKEDSRPQENQGRPRSPDLCFITKRRRCRAQDGLQLRKGDRGKVHGSNPMRRRRYDFIGSDLGEGGDASSPKRTRFVQTIVGENRTVEVDSYSPAQVMVGFRNERRNCEGGKALSRADPDSRRNHSKEHRLD